MSDETSGLLPLQAARKFVPGFRTRRAVHPNTLRRWIVKGVAVPGVGLVHLKATRIGGMFFTREEWVAEFIAAQQVATPEPPVSAAAILRESDAASRELEAMGA